MKIKSLKDLPELLDRAFKLDERSMAIKRLVESTKDPFAKVLFYENLIVFQTGMVFEKINILHWFSLLKNTGQLHEYSLPNHKFLMDKTLGSVIQLANFALSTHSNLLMELKKFNDHRNKLTHKMFDIDKIPKNTDLLEIAKKLDGSGQLICSELDNITADLTKQIKEIQK